IIGARAPGRLDVMGGIADYSGATVLELPLEAAAFCAVQRSEHSLLIARSANAESLGYTQDVTVPGDSSLDIHADKPQSSWAAYVLGCVSILRDEGLIRDNSGFRFYLDSDVPVGAGVSSSAAI